MDKIYFYIYKITSPSGKVYIGQTRNIKERKYRYSRIEKSIDCNKQRLICRSIKKYGFINHSFEIIKEGLFTKDEINKIEIEKIKFFKEKNISLNISNGGQDNTHTKLINKKSKSFYVVSANKKIISFYISIQDCINKTNKKRSTILKKLKNKYSIDGSYWIYEIPENLELLVPPKNYCNYFTILQFDLNGKFIKSWYSPKQLVNEGKFNYSSIVHQLLKNRNYSQNYLWAYEHNFRISNKLKHNKKIIYGNTLFI